jgi:hypothetical protein
MIHLHPIAQRHEPEHRRERDESEQHHSEAEHRYPPERRNRRVSMASRSSATPAFRRRAGAASVPTRPRASARHPAAEHESEAAPRGILTQRWCAQPHGSLVASPPTLAGSGGPCRRRSPPAGARERVRMLGVVAPGREIPAAGVPDRVDDVEREQQRHDPCCDLDEIHVVSPESEPLAPDGYDRLRRIAPIAYSASSSNATAAPKSLKSKFAFPRTPPDASSRARRPRAERERKARARRIKASSSFSGGPPCGGRGLSGARTRSARRRSARSLPD